MTPSFPIDCFNNPSAVGRMLQSALPGFADGSLMITGVQVKKVRRSASKSCYPNPIRACFELSVSQAATGRSGSQIIYAKVYRPGLDGHAYARYCIDRLSRPAFGQAMTWLPDLNMIVWALPNDPGLPQLQTLMQAEQLRDVLPWQSMGLVAEDYGTPSVELLHYEPEQRATLSYTLRRSDGSARHTVYAKTFSGDLAWQIDERFRYFQSLDSNDPFVPRVARPLGHDSAIHTFWQAQASGRPLLASLHDTDPTVVMGRVAGALSVLHDASLRPNADGEVRTRSYWLKECRRRLVKISRADPALGARATAVVDAIERQAIQLPETPLSLIHGDFHPGQLWIHEGRIVLFDFDEFTWGDPMEDLASFIQKFESVGALPGPIQSLIDSYSRMSPQRFHRNTLNWHLVIQSLLQVSRAFIFQSPGWRSAMRDRLARTEDRVKAMPGGFL